MVPLVQPLDDHNQRLLAHVHPPAWRNPDPAPLYDLVVIGGGTAGLVCAAGAAGLGARVALVERALLGGDCLNTGCVPSKALLRSARAVHEARAGAALGVRATADVDFAAVMARVRARRADIAPHDSADRLASLGVHVFLGNASFSGPRAVTVDGRRLGFRRAVIATGSRPSVPEIVAGRTGPPYAEPRYYTSENIFWLTERPQELLVVGAGPVGCELAQAFALLGTRVTLVETAPRVLPREDPDAAAIVTRRLAADGVRVVTGSAPDLVSGRIVLVATGRSPNVEGLDLKAAGVRYGPEGVHVDDRLRTSNPRVYAAGDVCSSFRFTHAADAMARIVIQNALFFGRRRASALVIPWCTYTFPEVAQVGVALEEAQRRGARTITIPLEAVDRSVVDEESDGFVRVHHDDGRLVGATIVAPHAGELIGPVASLMRRGATIDDWSADIVPYPTVAEVLRKVGDAHRRGRLTPRVRRAFEWYFALLRRR
ncbi:MAG: mercuric reductase [Acidobacteria bacterium]|nr:mercuric reductase [Acidobacteriota bacterium]